MIVHAISDGTGLVDSVDLADFGETGSVDLFAVDSVAPGLGWPGFLDLALQYLDTTAIRMIEVVARRVFCYFL